MRHCPSTCGEATMSAVSDFLFQFILEKSSKLGTIYLYQKL